MAHQEGHTLVLLNTLGLTGAELTRATIENNRRRREFEQESDQERQPPIDRKPPKAPLGEFRLNMSQMREKIGNLALTNQYAVNIPLPTQVVKYVRSFSSESPEELKKFSSNKLGFLCSEATLPVSSYATAEVKDNHMGITQEFAHTRLYTDLDFTFYVDDNYLTLRFFELWMDYISSGAEKEIIKNPLTRSVYTQDFKNYYRRFAYPNDYKSDTMTITKFERDYEKALEYTFINVFPKGLTSIPVSYGSADLLKVTVTFNFDRYIVNRNSLSSSFEKRFTPEEIRKLELG